MSKFELENFHTDISKLADELLIQSVKAYGSTSEEATVFQGIYKTCKSKSDPESIYREIQSGISKLIESDSLPWNWTNAQLEFQKKYLWIRRLSKWIQEKLRFLCPQPLTVFFARVAQSIYILQRWLMNYYVQYTKILSRLLEMSVWDY